MREQPHGSQPICLRLLFSQTSWMRVGPEHFVRSSLICSKCVTAGHRATTEAWLPRALRSPRRRTETPRSVTFSTLRTATEIERPASTSAHLEDRRLKSSFVGRSWDRDRVIRLNSSTNGNKHTGLPSAVVMKKPFLSFFGWPNRLLRSSKGREKKGVGKMNCISSHFDNTVCTRKPWMQSPE